MQIENGKLRISVGYSAKVPGGEPYSSHDFHAGISVETDFDGDLEEAKALFAQAETELAQQVKLATIGELGKDFEYVADGVIAPQWVDNKAIMAAPTPAAPQPAQAAPVPPAPVTAPAPQGGGGDRFAYVFGQGKGIPFTMDDGSSVEVEDMRPIKASNPKAAKVPDFNIHYVDGRAKRGIYLTSPQGQLKPDSVAFAQAVGFTV